MRKARKKSVYTAVDLFSGCGGLTLGLKQAGFKVIGAVEIDALAGSTYSKNHPEVKIWVKDIRRVTGPEMRRALKIRKGQLDLLAGCPPCQGFSSIRTRNGGRRVRDDRNNLVLDYLRLVKALRPKVVMMENVPALAENKRMRIIKRKLAAIGYEANGTPLVLNTADFGVPQRRRRMILVCSRKRPVELPRGSKTHRTVRQAIGKMKRPGKSGDPLHDIKVAHSPNVARLIRMVPKDGGSRADLPDEFHLSCHKRKAVGFGDVYGRMRWNDVAPTITGGCLNPSKGRFLHPSQNRAITLREAAVLQTFPKRYWFSLEKGKEAAALMIGNALPPAFIRRHGRAIRESLRQS